MRLHAASSWVCAVVLCALLVACLVGCSTQQPPVTSTDMTDERAAEAGIPRSEVAAVVEDRVITQSQVDEYIEGYRIRHGIQGAVAYQTYLDERGYTDWDLRKFVLRKLIDETLIEIEAERLGVSVEEGDPERLVGQLANRYPSRAAWINALRSSGYSEESYLEAVRFVLLSDALRDAVIPDASPTAEQISEYTVVVAPTLIGKRSSQILFAQSDYALAMYVYDLILQGEDFASLAAYYSIDATGRYGGDMGWDSINVYPEQYQAALDQLEVGDVSVPIRSSFGYHIIMCTDRYDAAVKPDGSIDVDKIPEDLLDYIKQSIMTSLKQQTFRLYVGNLEAKATIIVFDRDGNQVSPQEIGLETEIVDIVAVETPGYEVHPSDSEGELGITDAESGLDDLSV